MTDCSCCTFTIESSTTVVYLTQPNWMGEDDTVSKSIKVFDFWLEGAISAVDTGKDTEPLRLTGVERVCGDNEGLCFPMCFPLCFSKPLGIKFRNIWAIQNAGDEVTISGLGSCVNAVFIIRNFHFNTIPNVPAAYEWSFDLEYKRSS